MGNDTEIVDDGPWRATRLWNSIIRNLQVKKSRFLIFTPTSRGTNLKTFCANFKQNVNFLNTNRMVSL